MTLNLLKMHKKLAVNQSLYQNVSDKNQCVNQQLKSYKILCFSGFSYDQVKYRYASKNYIIYWCNNPFDTIMPKPPITYIEGEDRQFGGNELFIDLIPRSCWFTSIRSSIVKSDWDRLRQYVYSRAANQCECCKSQENLEAHERWFYDQEKITQKLIRIVALCKKCHFSTHYGRAQMIGMADQAKKHLMEVRSWDQETFEKHKVQAFALWRKRNKTKWKLDLQIVNHLGLQLTKKCKEQRCSLDQKQQQNNGLSGKIKKDKPLKQN